MACYSTLLAYRNPSKFTASASPQPHHSTKPHLTVSHSFRSTVFTARKMVNNVTTIASNFSAVRFTTAERDILLKLLIFSSRTTAWLLGRNHAPIASIQRWQLLMKQLALTAKILRTGRFIQQFNCAAAGALTRKHQDYFLAYVTVIRQLLIAVYLTFDNATIANSIGFIPWKGARRLEIRAFRIWFAAGVCGIITQIYSLYQLNLPNQVPEKQLIL